MSDPTVRINCVKDGCGTFPMDRALYNRYKRTGETWHCPAGHAQHFTESTEQKLRDRIDGLERKVKRLKRHADNSHQAWRKEKTRRKHLEQIVFERVTGILQFGEDDYRWSCSCGGHGIKGFDTPEDARGAWQGHRDRQGCGEAVPQEVIGADA